MSTHNPSIEVAVVMRKERIEGAMSRWQTWRWVLVEVIANEPGFGDQPRLLFKSDKEENWLHPGFSVELFRDEDRKSVV